ncbi:uncharacterized protein FIBRA_07458 [Fibroporia radiculosa]|uniref:Uncharacterized protein n=1 Tax=Fibroporia radiculosa TaxID=599839 RepID=J4GEI1_9APHY|nr:uncharacterized protein FIBRA_07458 [Fibroporia radiculosa]CCM05248.1 predicted protein [Fibroporia radiculosa]
MAYLNVRSTSPAHVPHSPALLAHKARRLRLTTGDARYAAPLELAAPLSLAARVRHTVTLPFRILMREPLLIVTTLYMSFLYGVMYLMFEAFPVVFEQGHHFSSGAIVSVFYLLIFHPRYEAAAARAAPESVAPEIRLELALWGAPLLAISFFWFGWTSYPSISYWAPMLSGVMMGFSVIWIFLALFNYIVDVYLFVAASALAANTVIRSIAAAGFPVSIFSSF